MNVIEGAYAFPDMEMISRPNLHLRKSLKRKTGHPDVAVSADEFRTLEQMEKSHIEQALILSENNKAKNRTTVGHTPLTSV